MLGYDRDGVEWSVDTWWDAAVSRVGAAGMSVGMRRDDGMMTWVVVISSDDHYALAIGRGFDISQAIINACEAALNE